MTLLRILIVATALSARPPPSAAAPVVVALELDDTIQPASLRYLTRGLRVAAEREAALVVIELDTPGGLLDSVRAMTSAILASPVPVAVHVAPSGARAASGGFFLLLAADLAAMAPGTNTGAARPVALGAPAPADSDQPEPPVLDKAVSDAAALARALAERRGRATEAAERAVVQAESFTAEEARELGLIDVVAADRDALLAALDGRSVPRLDGTRRVLALRGAEVVAVAPTASERVLSALASPQIAYLLLTLGMIGVLVEVLSPGVGVPGVAGALGILLGLYGLSIVPVNVAGVLLVAAGLALLIAELYVTSYGLLAVGGLASFTIGSLILVDAPIPELRIGPVVVIPVAIVLAVVVALLATRAVRSGRLRVRTGAEAMIGEAGTVIVPIAPEHEGKVFVHGEYWTATSGQPIDADVAIRVDAVDGLTLRVSPHPPPPTQGGMS